MERCEPCEQRKHHLCAGLKMDYWAWCECPCHIGEVADPLGRFLVDLAILKDNKVIPVHDDQKPTGT